MRKIAIVGAGVSGLTCANLLRRVASVAVFEKEKSPGGLIRCERHDAGLFHLCGGHVFNTKDQRVMDWFWKNFDRNRDFIKADRNSAVCFDDGRMVGYPVENHVYQMPEDVQRRFEADLRAMESCPDAVPGNFDAFLRGRFGKTLYELYFKPYNAKIWRRDLTQVPLSWLAGKLPMPTVAEMRKANGERLEERSFVHSSFWYERNGGSQFLADALAKDVDVRCGVDVSRMTLCDDGKIGICGERFDKAIFCGNVKDLPMSLDGVDLGGFAEEISSLESHGTTAAFCELDVNPYSWVYQPSIRHDSHRIICTGNFAPSNNAIGRMTGTVEFTDFVSDDDIRRQLPQMPFHPRFLRSHHTPCSYPIQNAGTRDMIAALKDRLAVRGVHLVGRFAEWEYYNMDAAMASAMRLIDEIP